ncbi:MAG TPA: transglycosylase SLT domain-containing protein [Bacteroidota bacterium]
MLIRFSILLKGVLFTTLSVISVAVCLAPLSSGDILRIRGEQRFVDQLASAPSTEPAFPGLEKSSFEAVKTYSAMYGVDFRLILAIINQESRFDGKALSGRGARGYMQIMPVTNSELREELDLPDPELPLQNIRAGVYYFSKLYALFPCAGENDRLSLALAAYNAGPARIYDAQELAAYVGEDGQRWSSVQSILPLLSKRYYSLHETVWEAGRPPSGYFGESRQTIGYVRAVLKSYAFYQSVM